MSRTLRSRHAEDVGGVIVEPGQPIPDDADPDDVKRLEDAGLLADEQQSEQEPPAPSKRASSSKGE